MDIPAARAALAEAGFTPARIEPIEGGWASWTFELDGELIVRFPRVDEVRAAHERERRLLPVVAAHVSFRVPEPLHPDVFVYEKIPGRPFTPGDDVDAALSMIDELHAVPHAGLDLPRWRDHLAESWVRFERDVLPRLDHELAERARAARDALLADDDWSPVLVHDDLGPEHLLVDDRGCPVGMIDFEDVCVGDPEVDLVLLHDLVGLPLTPRMAFFRMQTVLHAMLHFGDPPARADELRRRLDSLPGQ